MVQHNHLVMIFLFLLLPVIALADYTDKNDTSRLIFRGDYNYPPLEYLDEKGEPAGFTVDLMQAVSEVMGLNINIKLGPWYMVKEELRKGRTDGLIAMYFSRSRDEDFDFGDPYLYMYHSLFITKDRHFNNIENLDKYPEPTVILQNSSFLQQFILSYNPNTKFIIVDTQVEGLRLLAGGQYDFALLPSLQGMYLIDKYKLTNIKQVDQDLLPRGYGFSVKEGDTVLLQKLNQGLQIIKANGKFDTIYDKWFGKYKTNNYRDYFKKYLLIPLIGIISAFILVFVIIILLRRKVEEQTRKLNLELAERKKAQDMLKIEKERAEESDRLKSAFLANMSHEIRTPMNAILGFANLLGEEDISPDEQKEYTELININSKALLELINDIIDVAKIEARQLKITKEAFYLNKFLDEIQKVFTENLRIMGKPHLGLRLSIPEEVSEIQLNTDSFRLRQILNNLLGNAIKFTHKGFIEFGYTLYDQKLQFFVKDTGIGISENKKEIIFGRFRQVDDSHTRNYGGTGLGLSISLGLVQILGGNMWLESASGKGSVFYFTLPLEEAEISEMQDEKYVQRQSNLEGRKIIVAEDVKNNFMLINSILKKEGAEIYHAENGRIAIDLYKNMPDTSLILMDIRMPIMNGFEALEGIRNINHDIPVIALTAYAMKEDIEKLQKAGFNSHVIKPLQKNSLIKEISRLL